MIVRSVIKMLAQTVVLDGVREILPLSSMDCCCGATVTSTYFLRIASLLLRLGFAVSADSANMDSKSWILRKVSVPDAFFFFVDSSRYTGHFAVSLLDLYDKINRVPVQSVEFHFRRSDIIKWVSEIIGDKELGSRIQQINPTMGGNLKVKMQELIKTRLEELSGSPNRF